MFRHLAITMALVSAFAVTACQSSQMAATTAESAAQAQMTPSLSTTDATFLNTIGAGGIAEIKFGQLAQSRTMRDDVRGFAAQMVTDHTAGNQELVSLAQSKALTPPNDMDLNHRQAYDKLSATAAVQVDQVYVDGQVNDHTAAVALFQDEIANGSDADVKAFAQKHLPTIQHHLEMARSLAR